MSTETKQDLLEALYEAGIRKRPSLQTKMEELEEKTYKACNELCKECSDATEALTKEFEEALHEVKKSFCEKQDKLIADCEKETGRNYRPPQSTVEEYATAFKIPESAFRSF